MNNRLIYKSLIIVLGVVFFASCDTDYNNIGANIINDDIHHDMLKYEANVVATDVGTGVVQANNLPQNLLGVLESPVFGKTIAHFVTQIELENVNPTLNNPTIDSVYMYVPYYSTLESTNADTGLGEYSLDSIYGSITSRFKLSVYENNYFLRDTDPGSGDGSTQKYYSNDRNLIEANRGNVLLNDGISSENELFRYSAVPIQRLYGGGEVAETFAPGMFLYLNNDFFQTKILNAAASDNLVNNNVFREYFRGIYFQAEQIGNEAVMGVPRFDQGTITIKYTDDKLDLNGNPVVENGVVQRESKSMTINLTGNTVNFLDYTYPSEFTTAITTNDDATGDQRLYVKGGEGSLATINILSDQDIATLKEERILINDASLTFYIDQDVMENATEPLRVYLYDLNNKRPLLDYGIDNTSRASRPKFNKFVHGGIIQEDDNDKGLKYKIRITNHVSNIINNDSTNVKLGLVVTENINVITNAALKTPFTTDGLEVKTVPVSSVIHPFGTVLYGSNSTVPEDKRLKLEIFYTKPN
ncbi:DUF4270 domain-containing protein [Flavobacterium litorale]|uniref:DUF4270 domain-containing protein n=1 Tax=Flavobacterium litorale TaxID=2856519 RepID=A0ABX8V9K7_9FLAO|nr:DUF4270 domain-containing protein [Flavobacterium litorale]QYJ69182.1 DUF4270 domain-containing protein [Flavobacterium litorale]